MLSLNNSVITILTVIFSGYLVSSIIQDYKKTKEIDFFVATKAVSVVILFSIFVKYM